MTIARRVTAWAAALSLFAAPLVAQQADSAKQTVKFTGNVGLVNASGNSDVTTFNAAERVDWAAGAWGITHSFSVVYGKNDGVTNASLWQGLLRGDRALGARYSLYALVAFDRNTFAGFDRRFEEGLGVGMKVLSAPRDSITAEAGFSYTQQHSITDVEDNFAAARVAGAYTHVFRKNTFFRQGLELLPDLQQSRNLRINSESDLVAPLSAAIALKVSYVIRFDNLPEPGFKKTDRLLTSGIQITF